MDNLETFIIATFEAMRFTDTGDYDQPGSNAPMSEDCQSRLTADCTSFWYRMHYYIEPTKQSASQAGHDFWLTRNGHGAGFWDGDWPEPYGDMLTKLAKSYGEFETYLGDDGLIHV